MPEPHEEAGRFVPLRAVHDTAGLSALLADIVPLLHLSDEPEQAKAVQYAMSEMVRNTLEHSGSPEGAIVCAQLYPGERLSSRRYVSIGIADAGQGVRSSLRSNYPGLASDREAVLKAMEPGVTGAVQGMYGASNNAGAGLFITRRLSAASRGYFGLYSGGAFFRSSIANRPRPDEALVLDVPAFPGTVVCVELDIDADADFAAMLASARSAFGSAEVERTDVERRVVFT
jgi:anti-sigma regulatory factor (Ser/Thr protein kinase)